MVNFSSGYRACKPASSAREFSPKHRYSSRSGEPAVPPVVDLRPYCPPIENQGELSSCTANGVVTLYEYTAKRLFEGKFVDMSRLFIYYNARARAGDADEDAGSVIQYAMESLVQLGACDEKIWRELTLCLILELVPAEFA
jgi:hypothetical protein